MACFATSKRVKQRDTNLIEAPDCVSMKGGSASWLTCEREEEEYDRAEQSRAEQEGFRPEAKLQIEVWKSEAGEIHSIKGRVRGIESFSAILNSSSELVRRSTYNNYSLTYLSVCFSVSLTVCLSRPVSNIVGRAILGLCVEWGAHECVRRLG